MAGPSSIIGAQAVRVSRLTADGTPDFGNAIGAFMLCGGISTFQHSFEVDQGADIFQKDAAGNACVIRKRPDQVKRASFTLTMCKDDYRLSEILGVAQSVIQTPGLNVVGRTFHAAAGCSAVAPNGVSIELWSEQWDCDSPLSGAPYMKAILPRAFLTPAGFTRQDGVSLPVYNGYATPNNNWGDGPFGDSDLLVGRTGWIFAELDALALPTCASPVAYLPTPSSTS